MVNIDKSAISFGKNCTIDMKNDVNNELNIQKDALPEKNLRLPTEVGKATNEVFMYLPTKIKELIGGWSGREASCAGREVLLKSVAQVVPTYSMSGFMLPVKTCKKMRTATSNYWWVALQTTCI